MSYHITGQPPNMPMSKYKPLAVQSVIPTWDNPQGYVPGSTIYNKYKNENAAATDPVAARLFPEQWGQPPSQAQPAPQPAPTQAPLAGLQAAAPTPPNAPTSL